jgi:hypothetical protein
METENKEFDAPANPQELRARLFGVVANTEAGDEWYWDDPAPMPEGSTSSSTTPLPATEAPPPKSK